MRRQPVGVAQLVGIPLLAYGSTLPKSVSTPVISEMRRCYVYINKTNVPDEPSILPLHISSSFPVFCNPLSLLKRIHQVLYCQINHLENDD